MDQRASGLIVQGKDICWAALEHRDMCGLLSEVRKQRDSRSTTSNDDDAFTGVVEVLWPELRVDNFALEVLIESRDLGTKWLFVVVVARP